MKSDPSIVLCLKCRHSFITKVATPRCSNCGSSKIVSASDAPRLYAGKDVTKLRIEFEEHKKDNVEVIGLLLDRIEALEKS